MWDCIAREFPVTWKTRQEPLTTTALAGYGVTKSIVMERLRRRSAQELEDLKIVLEADCFVLFGEKSKLPWASGGVYLGCDPDAPGLLMPVTLEPSLPIHIFEKVLRSRLPEELIARHPTSRTVGKGDKNTSPVLIAVLPQPLNVIAAVDPRPVLEPGVLGKLPVRRLVTPALGAAPIPAG